MSLSVGIVGLPNVGKSTLFNALLKKQQALAANYPFATIEPNVGIVAVPDSRLEQLAKVVANITGIRPPLVPATVEFVDIAGIVAGAHKGEGLGNKFLSHIREVQLVAHVVRDFADPDVVRTGESIESDYQTIRAELIFKDLETVESKNGRLDVRSMDLEIRKREIKRQSMLERLVGGFNQGKRAIEIVTDEEGGLVGNLYLLTMKPELVVVNVDENRLGAEAMGRVAKETALELGLAESDVVVVSAKVESQLAELDEAEAKTYLGELGMHESGLERLAKKAYERLGLLSFLTAGEIEVRAWTIRNGATAVEAAGEIHTDFMKKFIKAEVVNIDDFVGLGGWKLCREAGKVRLEGREYVMREGDVVEFKIGG